MNKSKFYLFFAAAAALVCLCGVFFYSTLNSPLPRLVSASADSQPSEFSLNTAQSLLSLCSSSYDPTDLKEKLSQKGYGDFEYFERKQDSHSGSGIAAGVACKEGNLILVFRGTNKGEWYSNFNIGRETEHAGFSAAADFALDNLKAYINKHDLLTENLNIQITGHSRGGAVANITAKRLIDEDAFRSVVAYTFASPNTTSAPHAHADIYKSIYNIINPEDFICYVPLEIWGYGRYGVDLELPKGELRENREIYEKMQSEFLLRTGYNHTGYPSGHEDVEKFLSAAGNLAHTTYDYYNKEIPLYPNPITLYEYMENAASLLAGEKSISKGMLLLGGSVSPSFHPITRFMMQGIRIEDISEDSSITHSAIGCAHTYETYDAWLQVLDKDYFKSANTG